MVRQINQTVSAGILIDDSRRKVVPKWVRWHGRHYEVKEVGFHHRRREGRKFWHVFSVNVGTLDMRLEIDGESFVCFLREVSDGLAN